MPGDALIPINSGEKLKCPADVARVIQATKLIIQCGMMEIAEVRIRAMLWNTAGFGIALDECHRKGHHRLRGQLAH